MRNSDLLAAYMQHAGYTRFTGDRDTLSPFVHDFLLDASKAFFDRLPIKTVKGPAKRFLGEARVGYYFFFKRFHSAFSVEQLDFLLDKVDDYEVRLAPHFKIAEIAYQELDNDRPFAEQKLESDLWMAHLLASDAQNTYGEVWRISRSVPMRDRYIEQVIHGTKGYAQTLIGHREEDQAEAEARIKRLWDAVEVIANKTLEWLTDDYCADTAQSGESIEITRR